MWREGGVGDSYANKNINKQSYKRHWVWCDFLFIGSVLGFLDRKRTQWCDSEPEIQRDVVFISVVLTLVKRWQQSSTSSSEVPS